MPAKVEGSSRFYPDFLWWVTPSVCWALDTTGRHLLNAKVRGKLIALDHPKVALVVRGHVELATNAFTSKTGWSLVRARPHLTATSELFDDLQTLLERLAEPAGRSPTRRRGPRPTLTATSTWCRCRSAESDSCRVRLFLAAHRRPGPHQGGRRGGELPSGGLQHGFPASMLTDNGAVFTAIPRGGGRCAIELELAALGIAYRHSTPYHPQTCGKVERLHQTLKRWLHRQSGASDVQDLQAQLDVFRDYYNTRPHRAVGGRTPAEAFAEPGDRMSITVWGTVPQPGTFDMVTKAHTSSVDPMPDNDTATIELVATP